MADPKDNNQLGIELYYGEAKETKKPFTCLKINIGKWSTLYFPKTSFEMDYIKEFFKENS